MKGKINFKKGVSFLLVLLLLNLTISLAQSNTPPSASLYSPDKYVTVTVGDAKTFKVKATDSDGNLKGAEWYFDNNFIGAHYFSGSSYIDSCTITFSKTGTYSVEVVVFDTDIAYSSAVNWVVTVEEEESNTPPSASLYDPSSSSVTMKVGESKTFQVKGTDSDGNLAGVEWYKDGSYLTTHGMSGSSDIDGYSFTFNSPGTHTIEAQVFDSNNAYSSPAKWTVTVTESNGYGAIEIFVIDDFGNCLEDVSIYVDKEYKGKTNDSGKLIIDHLKAGDHILVASKSDYEEYDDNIFVEADETKFIAIILKEEEQEAYQAQAKITYLSVSSGKFKPGNQITVDLKFENTGNVEWTYFIKCVVYGPEGSRYIAKLPIKTHFLLKGEESQTISFVWSIPTDSPAGSYDMEVSIFEKCENEVCRGLLDYKMESIKFMVEKSYTYIETRYTTLYGYKGVAIHFHHSSGDIPSTLTLMQLLSLAKAVLSVYSAAEIGGLLNVISGIIDALSLVDPHTDVQVNDGCIDIVYVGTLGDHSIGFLYYGSLRDVGKFRIPIAPTYVRLEDVPVPGYWRLSPEHSAKKTSLTRNSRASYNEYSPDKDPSLEIINNTQDTLLKNTNETIILLIGGPLANSDTAKCQEYFPVKVTNYYPGEHKGIIEVIDNPFGEGKIVLLAGSDREGTAAAVAIFKTLEELPEKPIIVDWNNGNPIIIEQ